MKVRDSLIPAVHTAAPHDPISNVARSIAGGGGFVTVARAGEATGVITGAHILRTLGELHIPVSEQTAADLVSDDLETVSPEMDLEQAWAHMRARDLSDMAVVERGRLVGMVGKHQHQHDQAQSIGLRLSLELKPQPPAQEALAPRASFGELANFFEGYTEALAVAAG